MKQFSFFFLFIVFLLAACDSEVDPNDMCGNGVVDINEECDQDNFDGLSCQALGFYGGNLSCNSKCELNESDCVGFGYCGDEVIQSSELCDGNNLNNQSCSSLGYTQGTLSCKDDCTFDESQCENINNAPEFTSTIPATALEDIQFAYEVNCTDPEGSTLSIEKAGSDTCGGTLSAGANGTATYVFTPDESQGGSSCQVALECSDTEQTVTQSLSVSILEDNKSPEITNLPATFIMHSGVATSFQLEVEDDDIPVQTIIWSISQNTCSFTADLNTSSGQLDFTCGSSQTCSLAITAEDNGTPVATDTKTISIECNNISPAITSTAPAEVTEGQQYEYAVSCSDADGDPLALQVDAGDTCNSTITDNGNGTGYYSFTATTDCTAAIKCTDTYNEDIQTTTITVNPMWTDVSVGSGHTCGLKSDNTLWCWGSNYSGELGNGTNTDQHLPTYIGYDWESVDCKIGNTCGLKTGGSLYCWGYNLYGQIGDGSTGSTQSSNTPVSITGSWSYLATMGGYHTCAKKSNTLWCWGYNSKGQLGNGNEIDQPSPVESAPGDWVQVSGGNSHTCGIKSDDTLWCWGNNSLGQLGNGNNTDSLIPVEVSGSSSWKNISAGDVHTCGIKADDTLWCWGYNYSGRLGDGTTDNSSVPVEISGSSFWKNISAGGNYTCGIKADDTLWCWGDNYLGKLGDGTTNDSSVPVEVSGSSSWKDISAGFSHTCGIKADNTLWCWGSNDSGQLGIGNTTESNIPVQIY